MTKFFLMLMFMNSIFFLICKTPLSMGLTLLMQTLMITMNSALINFKFWFSYILFIIMLGGMLVLFIYITSLTANMKFKFNKKMMILMMLIMLLMSIYLLYLNNNNYYLNTNSALNLTNLELEMNFYLKSSLKKMFYYPNYKILLIIINYLLFTLFIIVKIININKGPLRKT
uniref:NADH dehydrogenase subunit 6 n=1 Tax=Odontocimbex svenhedini TaxID=2798527 RepID=UPI002236F85B|nr:NADH dehydrogenase subunit 6 [Odontocimbex svenhedini]UYK52167.1 NADH dehydrogenase subunit 6 [Odontocimbex svenhedini]